MARKPAVPSVMREILQEWGRRGGKKGGPIGGKARWEGVTPEQRSEIARKAARARWAGRGRQA